LDVPSKVIGKGKYGLDAVVEGMVYARPRIPPTRYDSKVVSIDDSAAKRVPGYLKSLTLEDPSGLAPGWAMVFAESFIRKRLLGLANRELHRLHRRSEMRSLPPQADTDYAIFVLDSLFERFVIRNEEILPAWWRAAIQTEGKAA
jgi:hypothetical protein